MSNITFCPPKITSKHICYPQEGSMWYENTNNMVKWYIYDPIYHNNYTSLSLYFYYIENYQYYKTISFKNIAIDRGFYPFTIDNGFFPKNCTEKEIKWNYSLLLIGDTIDDNIVLNNTLIGWIPTDFILVQNASKSCSTNITNNNTFTDNSQNSSISQNEYGISGTKNIKNWEIIVIVICCLLFILLSIILLRLIYIKKIIIRKNGNCENIKNINIKEIKELNKDIIYTKHDINNKYEKPNSY